MTQSRWSLLSFAAVLLGALMPAAAGQAQLYYADTNAMTINRVSADGATVTQLATGINGAKTLASSPRYIWWVSGDTAPTGTINRIDRATGANAATFLPIGGVYWSVEFDARTGKVYYLADTFVGRMNEDGTGAETLFSRAFAPHTGLGVDTAHGQLYWFSPHGGPSATADAYQSNLDGTNAYVLANGYQGAVIDVTVDTVHNKLYLTSTPSSPNGISLSELDGTIRRNILTSAPYTDVTVDPNGGKMYASGPAGITQASLDGSGAGTFGTLPHAAGATFYWPHGTQLVGAANELAGDNCQYGGVAITVDYDSNANGMVDVFEQSVVQYVCNGAPGAAGVDGPPGPPGMAGAPGTNGHNSLVATANESMGSNCANGGVRVDSGVDANDNMTLDMGEITSTIYVCNGTAGAVGTAGTNGTDGMNGTNGMNGTAGMNGMNGTNGENSLIATSTEAAGANCANGGLRVDTGLDANADGTLATDEIMHTSYICAPAAVTSAKGGGCSAAGGTSSAPTWAFGVFAVMAFLSRRRAR